MSLYGASIRSKLGLMTTRYFALVGDLTKSRKQSNRSALAEQIEDVIRQINERFASNFVASLETTRGLDEVSSLLQEPTHAFDIAFAINLSLWPAMFRFGLGDGDIDVWGKSGRASDMDGSAFHHAAEALARGRSRDIPFSINIQGLPNAAGSLIEAAGVLHQAVMRDWTSKSADVIRIYRPLSGENPTQEQLAARLGQSQQAISEAIRRGHLSELTLAQDTIRVVLGSRTRRLQFETAQ